MKNKSPLFKYTIVLLSMMAFTNSANAQLLKKLGKIAGKAAERTIEERVDEETSKKTDKVLDSIFESDESDSSNKKKNPIPNTKVPNDTSKEQSSSSIEEGGPSIQVYSKFDFVPGDKLLFFDNFENDFVGDFPSHWNTNGSGELVLIGDTRDKWMKILPGSGSEYIPDITNLPEEFTIEFDVLAKGLSSKTSSQSYFTIMVGDNNNFEKPTNLGSVAYTFCQFIERGLIAENNVNGKREIRNNITAHIKEIVSKPHHVSVAVNKQRFRLWINEQKYIDIPRLLPVNAQMNGIKLNLVGIDTANESIFISNFKVAEGGIDLRRKLISEGKISTNGILFNTGSATIKPQSMGIIRQISQVLQQETEMRVKIVGHTDADGNEDSNLSLSKKRADAVKSTLVSIYNISQDRLSTEGKGESEPIGDNSTAEGKENNRRVEFIKQ